MGEITVFLRQFPYRLSWTLGLVLALLSGYLPLRHVLGGIQYGVPVPWRFRLAGVGRVAWGYDLLFLALDVAFWASVVYLGIASLDRRAED